MYTSFHLYISFFSFSSLVSFVLPSKSNPFKVKIYSAFLRWGFLLILLWNDTQNVSYAYESPPFQSVSITQCGQDSFEPNNRRNQAKHLTSITQHQSIHGKVCKDDVDWFSIWLNRGQWVEMRLESDDLGDLQSWVVFAPHQRKPIGNYQKLPTHHSVRIQVKKSGRYRVKLTGNSAYLARYTLSLIHLDPRYPHTPILTPSSLSLHND